MSGGKGKRRREGSGKVYVPKAPPVDCNTHFGILLPLQYDPEQIGVLMMKKTLTIMQVLTLW